MEKLLWFFVAQNQACAQSKYQSFVSRSCRKPYKKVNEWDNTCIIMFVCTHKVNLENAFPKKECDVAKSQKGCDVAKYALI